MIRAVDISEARKADREADANKLREYADRIECGAISEFSFVASDREEGCIHAYGGFDDRWRILGALEHAKATVNQN